MGRRAHDAAAGGLRPRCAGRAGHRGRQCSRPDRQVAAGRESPARRRRLLRRPGRAHGDRRGHHPGDHRNDRHGSSDRRRLSPPVAVAAQPPGAGRRHRRGLRRHLPRVRRNSRRRAAVRHQPDRRGRRLRPALLHHRVRQLGGNRRTTAGLCPARHHAGAHHHPDRLFGAGDRAVSRAQADRRLRPHRSRRSLRDRGAVVSPAGSPDAVAAWRTPVAPCRPALGVLDGRAPSHRTGSPRRLLPGHAWPGPCPLSRRRRRPTPASPVADAAARAGGDQAARRGSHRIRSTCWSSRRTTRPPCSARRR